MDRIKSIDAQVVDNSLDVTVIGQDFNFWKLFYFSDTTTQINVTLPAVKLESARYESAVGSFDYNGNAEMDIGTVSFSASTGSIRVANVTMSSGEISSSTGTVTVRSVSAKDIKISTSTGSIYGDVKGASKVKATASTGSVEVDIGVASAESIVELSTNTGSVTSIITGFTGKYKGSTSTGSVKVVVAGSDVSSGKKESSGNVGDGRGDLVFYPVFRQRIMWRKLQSKRRKKRRGMKMCRFIVFPSKGRTRNGLRLKRIEHDNFEIKEFC
ncbi:hypothetical protein BC833DRAFT_662424 [Globomyces pollinis-pini]|nr:hypothetical protein BC833DRAFT_662424 [Globomyces pollinis-pini]